MIYSIISQHVEEASFLYTQRSSAVFAPHYSLTDLVRLDMRLAAHLDGLQISGRSGWELCEGTLKEPQAGDVFVASTVGFAGRDQTQTATVLRLCAEVPSFWPEVGAALGWLPFAEAREHIFRASTASSSALRLTALVASVFHRQHPGKLLTDSLHCTDAVLCQHAARSVGLMGLPDLIPMLYDLLDTEEHECRYSAAWSLSLLGDNGPLARFVTNLALKDNERRSAINLMVRREDSQVAHAWCEELADNAKSRRDAVIAAGATGDPAQMTFLLDCMTLPELARVAGEAVGTITGLNLADADLDTEAPTDFHVGPTEDPEDDVVAMDVDADLPWPDPEAVRRWWLTNRSRFQPGIRHLLGRPISDEWLSEVLRAGRQRERAAAALELAIRHPGQPLFNTESPGFRQRQLIGIR